MSALGSPLLIHLEDNELTKPQSQNSKSKCIQCIFLPLDVLICPFTSCMKLKCWKTRRYFQYDLAIQCYGIFQTLIAAFWASGFRMAAQFIIHGNQNQYLIYVILYVILSHFLSNIVLVLVQKSNYFNQKMSFFIGTLGHISAFGYKELSIHILKNHFSSSLHLATSFLFICFGFSILSIYGLSILRKYFCFTASYTLLYLFN
eukprot:196784_1